MGHYTAFRHSSQIGLDHELEETRGPSQDANYIIDLERHCLTIQLTPHAQFLKQSIGTKAFAPDPTTATTAKGFLE